MALIVLLMFAVTASWSTEPRFPFLPRRAPPCCWAPIAGMPVLLGRCWSGRLVPESRRGGAPPGDAEATGRADENGLPPAPGRGRGAPGGEGRRARSRGRNRCRTLPRRRAGAAARRGRSDGLERRKRRL